MVELAVLFNRTRQMKKNFLALVCGVIICCSCSEDNYLQGSEMDLAELNRQYELSKTTEVVAEEDDSLKIETRADESEIQSSMQEYVTELMNQSSTAKEKVMRSAYGTPGDLVGVLKVGSCGRYKELHITLDCEDKRGSSKTTGNVGTTFSDGSQNINFHFCLTEANRFYPGGVLLIDNIDYGTPYINTVMDVIVRHHDTEDSDSRNSCPIANHIKYNSLENISNGLTKITPSDAILAWAFPRPGDFIYPSVPPPFPVIGPTGIQYGLLVKEHSSTGTIFCDDEDKSNKNWAKEYSGDVFKRDITERSPYSVMALDGNTTYYVAVSTDNDKFRTTNYYYNLLRYYGR